MLVADELRAALAFCDQALASLQNSAEPFDLAPFRRAIAAALSSEGQPRAGRKVTVYWCPICNVQTARPWHSLRDGGLIPQNDTEHTCEEHVLYLPE